jgi:hypothetical protein
VTLQGGIFSLRSGENVPQFPPFLFLLIFFRLETPCSLFNMPHMKLRMPRFKLRTPHLKPQAPTETPVSAASFLGL